jgi:hypothetical protein
VLRLFSCDLMICPAKQKSNSCDLLTWTKQESRMRTTDRQAPVLPLLYLKMQTRTTAESSVIPLLYTKVHTRTTARYAPVLRLLSLRGKKVHTRTTARYAPVLRLLSLRGKKVHTRTTARYAPVLRLLSLRGNNTVPVSPLFGPRCNLLTCPRIVPGAQPPVVPPSEPLDPKAVGHDSVDSVSPRGKPSSTRIRRQRLLLRTNRYSSLAQPSNDTKGRPWTTKAQQPSLPPSAMNRGLPRPTNLT